MKQTVLLTLLILVWLLLVPAAQAQDGDYELVWWTADGGGMTGQGGANGYFLGGTIGQHDAATWTGGGYTLSGGFWVTGPAMDGYEVFLPLVIRGSGP